MSNVCVLSDNYADSDYYTAFTYSSQQTNMPASNVLSGTRRTKAWRSAGCWEITSTNKGIVLQEVAGVNQTVNIAEATYTTDATFLTAVKAALDGAAGTAVYTVARDTTTNKIKITSDGAGGAVFRLMCTSASFTAATTLGFSTSADRTGALTYTADTLKIHTSEWLKFDLGSAFLPKAVVLIGQRNTSIKLSQTATITLEGNNTDAWTSPTVSVSLSYNSYAIGSLATAGLGGSAQRYWRVKIVDTANVYGYVELSNVYLGGIISTTQGAVQFPLRDETVDIGENAYGRSGISYGDTVQMTDEISFTWSRLTTTEKESLKDFTTTVGKTTPFFIALDPNGAFSSSAQRQMRFVKFKDSPKFELTDPNLWDSDWAIREEI
jgi:hypothetical protein